MNELLPLDIPAQSAPLVLYDAMCTAIAAAYEVDEVADLRNRALAMETYARLALNTENERLACEIRLRAERRAGQLLRAMEKAKGGQPYRSGHSTGSDTPKSLSDLGITKDQSANWQKMAAVPEPFFEQAVRQPGASTTGIIAGASDRPRDKVDEKTLWLWGRLREFESMGLLDMDAGEVMATMLPHMKETALQLAPRVAAWLGGITS